MFTQAVSNLADFVECRGFVVADKKPQGDLYKDKFMWIVGPDYFAGVFSEDFSSSADTAIRKHYKNKAGTVFIVSDRASLAENVEHANVIQLSLSDLLVNPLQHIATGKVRLLSDEEVAAVVDMVKAPTSQLPKIMSTDPVAVWLGAKKGNVLWNSNLTRVGIEESYLCVV
jgi:DNA-directed RNA polymerase subunit H (RpoH/RPB5)